jgi:hypothetical protein
VESGGPFDSFSINENNGKISFTSSSSDIGEYHIIIIAMDLDNEVNTSDAIFFLVNDIPEITTIGNQSVLENNTFDYAVGVTNTYGNLNFSDNSSYFEINQTSGLINFTTNDSIRGEHHINITACDNYSSCDSEIFMLAINDRPALVNFTAQSVNEDSLFTYNFSSNVTNVIGTLNFSANATFFNLSLLTGLANFTPDYTEIGNHTINITVMDEYGGQDSQLMYFNVTAVNDPPIFATIGNKTTPIDIAFYYEVNASDEEGDNITYFDNTSLFNINITSGAINFTPNLSHIGSHYINISVNDTYGDESSEVFNLTVILNYAPGFPANQTTIINASDDAYVCSEYPNKSYNNLSLVIQGNQSNLTRIFLNFIWIF